MFKQDSAAMGLKGRLTFYSFKRSRLKLWKFRSFFFITLQFKFSNFIHNTMFHSLVKQMRSSVVKKSVNFFIKNMKEYIRLNLK